MALIRALCVLHMDDENPENYVVNTLHFSADNADVTTCNAISDDIIDAYDAASDVLAGFVSFGTSQIKFYDLSDPEPRAPIVTTNIPALTTSGASLPTQLAICLSFQGAPVSGSPQARRRGRIFLGPVNDANEAFLSAGRQGVAASFGTTLLAASEAAATWNWVVYSRVNDSSVNVVDGWVDNRYDTVRSRAQAPTNRLLWP